MTLSTESLRLFCVQVKQIMEEAVTKKFVHEDSSHIIALCSEYSSFSLIFHHMYSCVSSQDVASTYSDCLDLIKTVIAAVMTHFHVNIIFIPSCKMFSLNII